MRPLVGALLAASLSLLAVAPPVPAEEVWFPLTLDHEVLRAALQKHVHTRAQGNLELWRSADGCGSFVLRDVAVGPADGGRLRLSGPARATGGLRLFGLCWANVSWAGHAEILARPEIGPDWQLRLRDLDTQLQDGAGRAPGISTRLWTVVTRWADAALGTFAFDLGPPVAELTALLRGFGGADATAPLATALGSLRPRGLAVERDGVSVMVALDLPTPASVPHGPEPALAPTQIERWEARLDGWDGFVSFIVKELAGDNPDPGVRDQLLSVLLQARRAVVDVLARGPEAGTDAVRQIFVATWEGLRDVVRQTAIRQHGEPPRAFRYVVFLAGGDALRAIDAAAPAAGLDFSADGLRRLARSLEPGFSGDPLELSDLADPRLQQLFRFRDPDAPPRRPRGEPPRTSFSWFGPRIAQAAEVDDWRALAAQLHRWVPTAEELVAYRATVDRLLSLAADRSRDPDALHDRFDDLFQHLVKATAWQESCWRQFVRRSGDIVPLESRTGDVGLMQINVRIWRGFFDAARLRDDAAYNAGAGAEILQQFLVRYGAREARERLENAARATYAAYNRGPARYQSYRTATKASVAAAVDHAFWEKYQAMAAGTAADRVLCLSRPEIS